MEKNERKFANNFEIILLRLFLILVITILAVRDRVNSLASFHDEAFSAVLGLRLLKGDALFIHEWDAAQMHAFWIYPFVKIWYLLTDGQGVMIFLRYIWLFIKIAISCWFIKVNRKRYPVLSLYSIFVFLISDCYNTSTLTYNTIVCACGMITVILFQYEKLKSWHYYIMGTVWGVAIVAQPFCILIPIAYMFMWMIYTIQKKKIFYNKKVFVSLFIGCFFVGLMFVSFVLSRCSVGQLIKSLSYVLDSPYMSDSKHGIMNWVLISIGAIKCLVIQFPYIILLHLVMSIIIILGKKRKIDLILLSIVSFIGAVLMILEKNQFIMNYQFVNFFWMGVNLFIYYWKYERVELEKYERPIAYSLLFAIGGMFGSNTGILVGTSILSIYTVIILMMYGKVLDKELNKRVIAYVAQAMIVTCVLASRIAVTWGDMISIDDFRHSVKSGPLKGSTMKNEWYEDYIAIEKEVENLQLTSEDKLLCLNSLPIAYFFSDAEIATSELTFSEFGFDESYSELCDYLYVNPDKKPTKIYMHEWDDAIMDSSLYDWLKENYDFNNGNENE